MSKSPVRVAVTGAAGQIGYSILFRIAGGEMLGKDHRLALAEHFAAGDPEKKAVADLTGGAGDGDANGFAGHGENSLKKCEYIRLGVFAQHKKRRKPAIILTLVNVSNKPTSLGRMPLHA